MPRTTPRYSFLLKIGLTILLVVAFDRLFPIDMAGAAIGCFALLSILTVVVARPALRRSRASLAALAVAGLCGIALIDSPGLLAWAMAWAALAIATLLPRTAGFDDAWRWTARVVLHAASTPGSILGDVVTLFRRRPRDSRTSLRALAAMLALPLIGTAIFVLLFANANPLVADLIGRIELPLPGQLLIWGFVALCVWPMLRPRPWVTRAVAGLPDPEIRLPGTSLPSVLIALILFNTVFAIQNGLDIAYLWSGAPLPQGVAMTAYVHRGAYPLIATALLAGFFVLAMLRPGSTTAANPLARRLVLLWVAQNILLVASSALRTLDYIGAYLLTEWRIAALAWMALVATGLVLICWRIWWGRSARWLINANALAALIVLLPCCFLDLGAIAASWNVRHAREVGGAGEKLDLCYLAALGSSALLPLIEFEQRPLAAATRDQARWLREQTFADLATQQADWHRWTPRDARRLAEAQALLGPNPPHPAPLAKGWTRGCEGLEAPAEPEPSAPPAPPARPAPALPIAPTPASEPASHLTQAPAR